MTTATVFRTTWTADNVHITDERGHLHRNYFAALWAERFNNMTRGRFLIGTASVQFTKGEGYRIIVKDANKARVIDETVKDCPSRERVCALAAQWITDHKPEGLVAHCERRGVEL